MKRYVYTIVFLVFLLVPLVSRASITDDANYASITWTATVSGTISSYNYDTATFQSWNNGSTWGPFSVADWTGYFGSFTHIRVFDGNCSALSMASCQALGNGYADYWVDGSNWSPTDPSSGPVYGCTDPLANNYDPEATDDDDSCTYDSEPVDPSIFASPFTSLYATASSTCIYVATGTYQCWATSTPVYIQDAGNLSLGVTIIIVLLFLMTVGFLFNNMTTKKPWH